MFNIYCSLFTVHCSLRPRGAIMMRTHSCGQLKKKDIGKEVTLCGWVQRRRDHGGLIFIDLKDREGITQAVFNPKVSKESHRKAHQLRSEYVLSVEGKVSQRPK